MHLALYSDVIVFDHATKLAYVIAWVHLDGSQVRLEAACHNQFILIAELFGHVDVVSGRAHAAGMFLKMPPLSVLDGMT